MSESIVRYDAQALIDSWLEAEQNGKQFPVDFDIAWQIAGYSDKGKGKRRLTSKSSFLVEGQDYLIEKGKVVFSQSGKSELSGRSGDKIVLSCDAFKHFCLMSETQEGRNIRQYFVEAEKKWKLVQEVDPEFAAKVELINLQIELARIESQKETAIATAKQADLALVQYRGMVATNYPEPIQQKILGYQVVQETEYRDRIIKDDQLINDGSTTTKTELCRRYGMVTKSGSPDYRRLNHLIEQAGLSHKNEAWEETYSLKTNQQLKREFIPDLDKFFQTGTQRTLFLGE